MVRLLLLHAIGDSSQRAHNRIHCHRGCWFRAIHGAKWRAGAILISIRRAFTGPSQRWADTTVAESSAELVGNDSFSRGTR